MLKPFVFVEEGNLLPLPIDYWLKRAFAFQLKARCVMFKGNRKRKKVCFELD